jgi:hypothetical protein
VAAADGGMTGVGPGLSNGVAGDCTTAACPLWASPSSLAYYDKVLLSCEGDPYVASKPASAIQAMHDWLNGGGQLFATHSQSAWFQSGPADFQGVAAWKPFSPALASGVYAIDSAFRDGLAFENWLGNVDASTSAGKGLALSAVSDSVGTGSADAQSWIVAPTLDADTPDAAPAGDVKLLSFETPVGGIPGALYDGGEAAVVTLAYCGEAVFTDVHAGSAPSGDLPDACSTGPLSAQEKALEFIFFDGPSCKLAPVEPHP